MKIVFLLFSRLIGKIDFTSQRSFNISQAGRDLFHWVVRRKPTLQKTNIQNFSFLLIDSART